MKPATIATALFAVLAVAGCDMQQQQATTTTSDSGHTVTSRPDKPDVVGYAPDDPAMTAAISDAQAHLPYFWERQAAPASGEESFMLKVAFPTPQVGKGAREHIWVSDFQKSGAGYAGLLANEPVDMTGKKLGDSVEFSGDMITDWGFMREGKLIGYYTTRITLDEGDPKEAAQIRAMLGENPK